MLKLKKMNNKNNSSIKIIIISVSIILFIISIFFIFKSNAFYKIENNYDVIQAKIGEFGLPSCTISGNPTNWVQSSTLVINYNSGKNDMDSEAFSWDKTNWTSNNTRTISSNGTYTAYVKDNKGNIKSCSVNVTKIDNTTPIITMNSGIWDKNDITAIATATFGSSGGTLSCINASRSNKSVTTINSIATLGPNVIKCSAKSNTGIEVTKTSTITIQHIITYGDGMSVTGNGASSGTSVILNHGGVQFGPYYNTNAGCYHIIYEGSNLNVNAKASADEDGYLLYRAYTNDVGNYEVRNLSANSNKADFYLYFTNNIDYLEVSLYNLTTTTVKVDRIWFNYYGTTCP